MIPYPTLSELGSSLAGLGLVLGIVLLLPVVVDPKRTLHRSVLLLVAAVLMLRYAWWRATETLAPPGFTLDMLASWSLFAFELATIIGTLSSFVIMCRVAERSAEADEHAGWWQEKRPRVAILIATYNESLDVLERTIIGALALRHDNKEVLVLDDGRRDWLRDYCARAGVRYVIRPDNTGSKAGNINHALQLLARDETPPDFVAVLDADFVPHRGFLSRGLALFHDPRVGLVQTPQHFFNPDPIQHNLGVTTSYPDEQRFFFDHMQTARDGWGIAFCCGTSSITRWTALEDIGGLPTESVTEDFMLTLALQNRGWSTVYLAEPLTEGLAPEGLKEYISQRSRWCLGLMQIVRSSLGPFSPSNLRLRDRWSVLDSAFYWLTTYTFRIAAIVFPLFYWYFGATVVDARLPDVVSYFGTSYLWTLAVLNVLSRSMVAPIVGDVSQLIGAIQISRAALVGLLKPHGHPFSVTAKGGDRSQIVVQWRLMAPFAVMFALTFGGLTIGIFSDRFAFGDAGDGKWVVLFWTLYNLVVLAVTMVACIELPRTEVHIADEPETALFSTGSMERRVWIVRLGEEQVRLRGHVWNVATRGRLSIDDVGDVECEVTSALQDGVRLRLHPTPAQRQALLTRLYIEGDEPGTKAISVFSLIASLSRRLTASSRL